MRVPRRFARRAALVAALALLASCRSTVAPSGARPPPREPGGAATAAAYFSDPLLSHVSLSPDGTQIAAVSAREGVSVLIVRAVRGGEVRRLAKLDEPGETIRTVGWANDSVVLVGVEMPTVMASGTGPRRNRVIAVEVARGTLRYFGDAWPKERYAVGLDRVIDWLPDDPDHVLIHYWESGRSGASAARVDVNSGKLDLVVSPLDSVERWYADREGRVRAGEGVSDGGSTFAYGRATADGSWQKIDAGAGFRFAGFSPNPRVLYLLGPDASGRSAVFEYDLAPRSQSEPRLGDPRYDVGPLVQSRLTGKLVGVEVQRERPAIHFVDPAAEREQAAIDRAFPGTTNRIVSRDRAEKLAIVAVSGDVKPPAYYVYDREKKQMDFLFAAHPDLVKQPHAPTKPVRYAARDGLEIEAYLTLPQGPVAKLPTIVMPHGGPTARDVWGWNDTVQFLASRGFAVFQPNFRGSAGYGRDHQRKGQGQWGGAMQDDLVDGVKWLVREGIADPDRVGIYGVGYGGYAALMALARSEGFRAGASRSGFTDLVAWRDDREDYLYRDPNAPVLDPAADRDRLAAISPAYLADRIRVPVLIAHGEQDPLVRVEQAHAMADALEKAGAKPELYVYRDEVHEFVDERNRIDFHEKLAAFFTQHLAAGAAAR